MSLRGVRIIKIAIVLVISWFLIYLLNNYLIGPEGVGEALVNLDQEQVPESESGHTRQLVHTVQRGETLAMILSDAGIETAEAYNLISSLRAEWNVRSLKPGDRIELDLDEKDRLAGYNLTVSPVEVYTAKKIDNSYKVVRADIPVETKTVRRSIELTSSLYNALISAGESPVLIDKLVDIFAWDIDFDSDPRQNDSVSVLVEKSYVDGKFYKYGRILAAEYDGEIIKQTAFYYKNTNGEEGYFDEKGLSLARNFLKTPVKYTRISSRFGMRRHPVTHNLKKHMGTDYAAPTGAPAWAMADGVVVQRTYSGLAGNYIAIKHGKGYVTRYLHLSKFYPGIHVGSRVKQKDLIGYVGTTGRSTGPHLHLEVIRDGQNMNPLKIKKVKQTKLAGKNLESFKGVLVERLAELRGVDDSLFAIPLPNPADLEFSSR